MPECTCSASRRVRVRLGALARTCYVCVKAASLNGTKMPGYAYVVYSDDDENEPAILETLRSASPEIHIYTFDGHGYDEHLDEIRERTAGCTVFVPILSQRSARLPWMRSMTEVAIQAD